MRDLFDVLDDVPAAASADPGTSHEAARAINASGGRAAQTRLVADAVRRWPGKTSAELAVLAELDRHMVAKRCPDAEKAGLVYRGPARVCETTRGKRPLRAVTWWPVGAQS